MASGPAASHLLDLPSELRLRIYDFLLPPIQRILPVPGVDIASISHRPPPSALLLISKGVSKEIFDHYMDHASFRINVQYSFNFFRIDPDLDGLDRWPRLQCVRHVELFFTLDHRLLAEYPSLGLSRYCDELRTRAAKACKALAENPCLRQVIVHFCDTTGSEDWAVKKTMFEPLSLLQRGVALRSGILKGSASDSLQQYLEKIHDDVLDYDLAMPRPSPRDWQWPAAATPRPTCLF